MADIAFTAANIRPLLGSITKPVECGEVLGVGKPAYIKSDGKAWLADAAAMASAQARGIVTAVGAYGKLVSEVGDMVDLTFYGPIAGFSSLTPGDDLFASAVAGKIGDAEPAATNFRWIIAFALAADTIFVNPFTDNYAVLT